jgi:hypothetical protein
MYNVCNIVRENIKHVVGQRMIESLFLLWKRQLHLFVYEANKLDDMSAGFVAQREIVQQFNEACQARNALLNVETLCTRENLEMLCTFMGRCVRTGIEFPEWTFVVTQLNLFVIEFERTEMFRGQGQAGAHAMDVHADMHTLLRRVSRLSDGC